MGYDEEHIIYSHTVKIPCVDEEVSESQVSTFLRIKGCFIEREVCFPVMYVFHEELFFKTMISSLFCDIHYGMSRYPDVLSLIFLISLILLIVVFHHLLTK